MFPKFRIATRGSQLALRQAQLIQNRLLEHFPKLSIEIIPLKTKADRLVNQPLSNIGGKGLFVKELEEALLNHEADIAVHSIKDMPVELPPGLILGAVCKRDAPHDVLISKGQTALLNLPYHAVVGTSSLRRAAQIKAKRPDLNIQFLRGNIDSRIRKFEKEGFDAIMLAYAGIERLQLSVPIAEHFDPLSFIPAIGQGALGIECRSEDEKTRSYIEVLEHPATRTCITAERALSAALGGNCHTPLGGYAIINADHKIRLLAFLGSPEGHPVYYAESIVDSNYPEKAGQLAAESLIMQGAQIDFF